MPEDGNQYQQKTDYHPHHARPADQGGTSHAFLVCVTGYEQDDPRQDESNPKTQESTDQHGTIRYSSFSTSTFKPLTASSRVALSLRNPGIGVLQNGQIFHDNSINFPHSWQAFLSLV
jgi:hypothetical protein